MDFLQIFSDFGEWIKTLFTKEYLLNVWDIAKIVLIILAIIIVIKVVIKLKFFRRVKLLLKNVVEINTKMDTLINLLGGTEISENKKEPLIKKFIKK